MLQSDVAQFNYKCTTLCGRIKGKSRDTNVMYPWKEGYKNVYTLENDATLYIDTIKPLLIAGLNLLILNILSL